MQVSCAGPSPTGDGSSAADSSTERSWQRSSPSTSRRTPAGLCGTSPCRELQRLPRSRPKRLRNRRCSPCSSPDGCSPTDHPRSATGPLDSFDLGLQPWSHLVARTASRPTRATEPCLMHCQRQRQAPEDRSAPSRRPGPLLASFLIAPNVRAQRQVSSAAQRRLLLPAVHLMDRLRRPDCTLPDSRLEFSSPA
jgi:hypothetical protein